MSVRLDGPIIHLEGVCGVEEAETLASWLDDGGTWQVDLSGCTHLHAAVVQALLACRPIVRGSPPADLFTKDFIHPALALVLAERGNSIRKTEGEVKGND